MPGTDMRGRIERDQPAIFTLGNTQFRGIAHAAGSRPVDRMVAKVADHGQETRFGTTPPVPANFRVLMNDDGR